RKRGKAPVHAEKDQDTLPPPRAGRAGVGAASDRRARRSRVGLAPIPTFPRKRGKAPVRGEKVQTRPPPPLAGEGWGGGRINAPRSTMSHRTPPPPQPAPASGGRGRCAARRATTRPLPRVRGGLGWGPHQIAALDD